MNEKIGKNIQRFIENMPPRKPFCRQNWFVHADRQYFNVEDTCRGTTIDHSWVFRSEQQLLIKVTPRYLIFFIRVVFRSLSKLVHYSAASAQLLAALRIMDADEINHFGGVEKHQNLINYVEKITGGVC